MAKLYNFSQHAFLETPDCLIAIKAAYEEQGPARSNLRYGYVPTTVV